MKLTRESLKSLISEVRQEIRGKSMLLSEMQQPQTMYDKIMAILNGHDPAIRTVGIMSGQNPGAQQSPPEVNARLAAALNQELANMGLQYDEIGGVFGGVDEDSVVIYNPSKEQMEQLNRMFKQWGFVWGESLPTYTMYEIDYNQPTGYAQAGGSQVVSQVLPHEQVAHVTDNYSFDKQTGKKFVIPLFGVP